LASWNRVRHLKGRPVVERLELRGNGLGDLAPRVPGVHAPQSRNSIEYLPAIGGPVVHAARADE
jgi:hypothetical protein